MEGGIEMNKTDVRYAYELADWLDNYYPNSYEEWLETEQEQMQIIAKILRQTAGFVENKDAYIAQLLAENEKLKNQFGYNGMSIPCSSKDVEQVKRILTDEEIMYILERIEYNPAEIEHSYDYEMRVARAILRKAQEK